MSVDLKEIFQTNKTDLTSSLNFDLNQQLMCMSWFSSIALNGRSGMLCRQCLVLLHVMFLLCVASYFLLPFTPMPKAMKAMKNAKKAAAPARAARRELYGMIAMRFGDTDVIVDKGGKIGTAEFESLREGILGG